ncbi:MAG: hypothetical protein ACK5CE_22350 [Actinomycetes bacterium]|jgi:hypothetical protein|uniref:Unannotated protein n=1 Tax=freshwater metagenome TaxID=449393 RepID=A0A6J6CD23_9ZZZZ|nr:hypothetical protein [Actinomycetota bacterium]
MSDDRRNPYVLLGLPYGASLAEARRAFQRRAREARWGDHDAVDLADLEWALARIELEHVDAAAAFGTYRVPADPAVLRPPAGFGLLAPAPRPAPRRSPVTPDDERAVVFDAARVDAAQHLLDRTAAAVGKRLERVADGPRPVVAVPTPPVRRRGWLPVVLVGAATGAVLAVAGISTLGGDDDTTATTTVATTAAATTDPPTTTAAPTTTEADPSAAPGLGEMIEYGGIEITPSEPLDGFGHLCLLFTIDGDVPLGFLREQVTLISGGVAIDPALGITTGRAPATDVFGDPAPALREICFRTEGWQERDTDLVYNTQVGNYRWRISEA